jgi:hypothetical protein
MDAAMRRLTAAGVLTNRPLSPQLPAALSPTATDHDASASHFGPGLPPGLRAVARGSAAGVSCCLASPSAAETAVEGDTAAEGAQALSCWALLPCSCCGDAATDAPRRWHPVCALRLLP